MKSILKKYQKLISNFSYLIIIEGMNKILPILVVPYIIHILGVEKYGILAFSLAIVMYFKILTNYSFDLTATKFISQHRENKEKISQYYWNVIFTKIILLIISFFLLLLAITFFEKLALEKEIIFFTFIMIIGEVMIPLWFFRGIEEMKYVAYFSVMTKLLYTVSIFLFIKEAKDYPLVALLNSISFLIVGVFSLFYIYKKYTISFYMPELKIIKHLLFEGKDIFLSNISVSMYTTTNNILLGVLSGYTAVGIYAMANTIYGAILQIIYLFNTVTYPHLSKYTNQQKIFIQQAQKFLLFYCLILVSASFFLYFFSGFIIGLLFGTEHIQSIELLHILSFTLLITPISGYLTHYSALKSEYKTIRKITFITMIINFILVYPFITLYGVYGVGYLMGIVAFSQLLLHLKYNSEIFIYKRSFI